MTEEEYNKASDLEQILYDRTGMLAKNHPDIVEAMERYADKFKNLDLHRVSVPKGTVCDCEDYAEWDSGIKWCSVCGRKLS